jgi:hypothetical protein
VKLFLLGIATGILILLLSSCNYNSQHESPTNTVQLTSSVEAAEISAIDEISFEDDDEFQQINTNATTNVTNDCYSFVFVNDKKLFLNLKDEGRNVLDNTIYSFFSFDDKGKKTRIVKDAWGLIEVNGTFYYVEYFDSTLSDYKIMSVNGTQKKTLATNVLNVKYYDDGIYYTKDGLKYYKIAYRSNKEQLVCDFSREANSRDITVDLFKYKNCLWATKSVGAENIKDAYSEIIKIDAVNNAHESIAELHNAGIIAFRNNCIYAFTTDEGGVNTIKIVRYNLGTKKIEILNLPDGAFNFTNNYIFYRDSNSIYRVSPSFQEAKKIAEFDVYNDIWINIIGNNIFVRYEAFKNDNKNVDDMITKVTQISEDGVILNEYS